MQTISYIFSFIFSLFLQIYSFLWHSSHSILLNYCFTWRSSLPLHGIQMPLCGDTGFYLYFYCICALTNAYEYKWISALLISATTNHKQNSSDKTIRTLHVSSHTSLSQTSKRYLLCVCESCQGHLWPHSSTVSSWCIVLHLTGLFKCLLISGNTNKQACQPGGEDKEWRGNGGHSSPLVTGIVLEQAPVTHQQCPQRSGKEKWDTEGDQIVKRYIRMLNSPWSL